MALYWLLLYTATKTIIMLANYFKTAWRNLIKHKWYAAINISGMALGATACLVIFLLVSLELSYDQFRAGNKKIYRIVGSMAVNGSSNNYGYTPSPLPVHLGDQISGVDYVAGFYNYSAKIAVPQSSGNKLVFDVPSANATLPVIIAQPTYFSIFTSEWLAGNSLTALNDPFKTVITDDEALRLFGKLAPAEVLGKQIIYNDSLQATVSGIIKSSGQRTDFNFTHFLSFATVEHSSLKEELEIDNWRTWNAYSQAFVKLSDHATPGSVQSQLPAFVKRNFPKEDVSNVELKLQPLSDIHFNATYPDAFSRKAHLPTLYALMGVAVFILLIASINYVNLSTALSIGRFREIGIRKVLGSSRATLMLRFFGETAIITFFAIILSVALIKPVLLLFQSFLPAGITLTPFQFSTWLFLAGIFFFISLFAGFYPASILSSYKPALTLKGNATGITPQKSYLRKALIVFQFAICIGFITGVLGVNKQIHYLLNKDLGFRKDAIINVPIPATNLLADNKPFAQKLRQIPAVANVSLHRETPLAARHGNTTIRLVSSTDADINASFEFADEHFVPLYGIKLLSGRNLNSSDTIKEFLINEFCAKALGFNSPQDAVGKIVQIGIGGKTGTIAGVMNNFHTMSLHETIKPFFITTQSNRLRTLSIKLFTEGKQTSDFDNAMANIRQVFHTFYPTQTFEYNFFDERIASFYLAEQKTKSLLNIAMALAIFISCMGLYGMTTFFIQARVKEIAIRKVLGAGAGKITALLFKDFLKPVLLALLISIPVSSYFLHRWLQDFSFRIDLNWQLFAASGMVAVLLSTFTICFQTIKAANANPVASINTE